MKTYIKYIIFRLTPHLFFDNISYLLARKENVDEKSDKEKNAYVLCGDFNRSVEDFVCNFDGKPECTDANVVVRTFGQGKTDFVCVYSPWFIESGKFTTESGSYFYKSNWERIDNIFSFGSLKISGFMVESEGNLAKEDGSPFKYSIYNGEGYSDHFPLVCTLLL